MSIEYCVYINMCHVSTKGIDKHMIHSSRIYILMYMLNIFEKPHERLLNMHRLSVLIII